MKILREYQVEIINKITQVALGLKRILVTMPTGSGKSMVMLAIAKHAISNNKRVLIYAPRREIVWQLGEELRSDGIEYGRIMSDEPHDPTLPIQIATIQSLYTKGIRRKTIDMPRADLVLADEGHHHGAESWLKVINHYPNSFFVGFTATPINKNGTPLGNIFETIIKGPSIKELTDSEYLCPAKYYIPPISSLPNLTGVKVQGGDYVEKQLDERMNNVKLIGDIVENWTRTSKDRKTIVFASSVSHSRNIAEQFRQIGIKAEHLDGKSPDRQRDKIVHEFKNGDLQIICNCALFTEGWDAPAASCLIFARPTKSLMLYLQIAGRVLRPFENKKNTIILDHAGAVYEHGILTQDFDWALDYGNKKTINKVMQKKKEKEMKKWITCAKCQCLYTGRIDCPDCGNIVILKGKPVNTFEAYLEELTENENHKFTTEDKSLWWRGLVWYAKSRNYNNMSSDGIPKWAYAKFQTKFHIWPHHSYKHLEPIEPPLDVKAWIKSQQIKWAHSQKRFATLP